MMISRDAIITMTHHSDATISKKRIPRK